MPQRFNLSILLKPKPPKPSRPPSISIHPSMPYSFQPSPSSDPRDSPPLLLPAEIISHIVSFIPLRRETQSTFWACTLVSRAWYDSSISLLYSRPHLHGGNFDEFVATVCPSKNAFIKRSTLAVLVRRLDMKELVHNASKSLTARLLGRLKGNIEEFIAPQASFAINSFAALSKCSHLHLLDLSLISASISNKLLFQTLQSLTELETLFFPRTTSREEDHPSLPYTWPPKLKALHLAGGINHDFLITHMETLPPTLRRLSIQHCSHVYPDDLLAILSIIGPQLEHLTIRHPMPQLSRSSLDTIFLSCSSLLALRISADFITNELFRTTPSNYTLRILDLECSPTANTDVEISGGAIYDAVENGKLPDLRSVRVSARLAWAATPKSVQDASDLLEILEENEMERPLGMEAEVWYNSPD